MKAEQIELDNEDEIKAEISRLENSYACLEARAERLEEEAKSLRNHAAVARNRKIRLKWLLA